MKKPPDFATDSAFKEKFAGFQETPPESVWENVKEAIQQENGKAGYVHSPGFFTGWFWPGISAVSIIALMIGLAFWFPTENTNTSGQKIDNTQKSPFKSLISQRLAIDEQNDKLFIPGEFSSEININTNILASKKASNSGNTQSTSATPVSDHKETGTMLVSNTEELPQTLINQSIEQETPVLPEGSIKINNEANSDIIAENTSSSLTEGETEGSSQHQTNMSGIESPQPEGNDYGMPSKFTLGLHFTPEIIVNPFYVANFSNNYNKYSYVFDLSAKYNLNPFFIQSGAGLSFMEDRINYFSNYEEYIYQGSYERVDDVIFDSINGNLATIYQTSTVHLYDTVTNSVVEQFASKYTYLNIPLLFGYEKNVARTTYFVKAGAGLSFLINKNEPEYILDPNRDIVLLNVDKQTPGRIQTNIHFLFSAGVSYQMDNNISIGIEPTLRYYKNSLYERSEATRVKPYSLGFKMGILWNI